MPNLIARLVPIALLICSNVFMTLAWYGHLKFKDRPLWLVILAGWGIAFFEYCLAVPANRWGSAVYSAAELKAIQEVVTLCVFVVFSFLYLGQKVSLTQGAGFALIAAGAFLVFHGAASSA
ncbi:MAG TPA: DMT family protein [Caulobacteraceae bacterium]